MQILNRYTNQVMAEGESLLDALKNANGNLKEANLEGANLDGVVVNWISRNLIGEILWQASEGDMEKEMLSAFIARKVDWCWEEWKEFKHPLKSWAISVLRGWVKEGDDAPDWLKEKEEKL